MATITEASFLSAVQTINEYLSNYVLVFLLLGVGIWYTIKTCLLYTSPSPRDCS